MLIWVWRNVAKVAKNHNADRFLSIHFNGFNKIARGVETLIRSQADGNINHEEDKVFATRVQNAVLQAIKQFDPGTQRCW